MTREHISTSKDFIIQRQKILVFVYKFNVTVNIVTKNTCIFMKEDYLEDKV